MIDWRDRKLVARSSTEAVILHHTEGRPQATVEQIDRLHRERGFPGGIGYHAIVRLGPGMLWHTEPGRPIDTVGAHAPGWNRRSVGIAIAGTYLTREPPQVVAEIVLGLVVELRSLYGPLRVLSHREAMAEVGRPGHTDCPGLGGWVDWIRDRLPADEPA